MVEYKRGPEIGAPLLLSCTVLYYLPQYRNSAVRVTTVPVSKRTEPMALPRFGPVAGVRAVSSC